MMELAQLPIIDWQLGTKLAGNKKELAKDMMGLLMKNLKKELTLIKRCYAEENYKDLLHHVHKLHGALCYCGVPRLKTVIAQLETELKNNIKFNLLSLLKQLDHEANLLFAHYSSQS